MTSAVRHKTGRTGALLGLFVVISLGLALSQAFGQYFGRNKVQYDKFDYKVLRTEHFDVYYYPEEEQAVKTAAQIAERWYKRLSRLLNHDLRGRQPLLMYATHPQFEQTTVFSDIMGEGTGGVTEPFKRRIVLPFGGTLSETDHVIGHELVHAFQYDIAAGFARGGYGQTGSGMEQSPLWVIEGQAEYLSIGPVDSNTSMWMRDMITKKKVPAIKDLRDPRYFPYRYGQAVWAYIGGRYGDLVVAKLLKDICRGGDYEKMIERTLGISIQKLSDDWHASLKKDYGPLAKTTSAPSSTGRLLEKGTEEDPYNLAPVLSPDGKKFVFISSRDLFSLEMFLGDTHTGKIDKRITKTSVDPHFQSIQFIYSAGSWSSDGKRFVFGAVAEAKPELVFLDPETRSIVEEIKFPQLGEILNPTMSPDGKRVAFSALNGGFSDIYIYDLETKQLKNMTEDPYGDVQPAWSPDGRKIAFVTERFNTQLKLLSIGDYQLAVLDVETGEIKQLRTFPTGKNINPQWVADSRSLFFVSDQSGIPNIFRINVESGDLLQVTNVYTGVSGIAALSPTLSVAAQSGDLLYSVYDEGNFSIYSLEPRDLLAGKPVQDPQGTTGAAILPPKERQGSEILGLLKNATYGLPEASKFTSSDYKPKLSLDYVAPPQVGVGYDQYYGAYGGGGIALYWSDMLGWHNLMTMAQVSSRLMDSAGVAQYVNSKNRMNWGFTAQRIPFVYGGYDISYGQVFGQDAIIEQEVLYRQIFYEAGGFASYPFNPVRRFELSAAYDYIQFQNVVYTNAYNMYTGEPLLIDERTDLPSPSGLHMANIGASLVYDSSFFGATGPILGQSYRLQVSPTLGTLNFYSVLADYRRYVMPVRPFTLAFRFMHYGRYGKGADDDRMYPMFLGYDWYIRGYDYNSFSANESFDFNRLLGSKMMIANFELRFPLFGTFKIGKGFYGIFPIDFVAFYDLGVAWGKDWTTGQEVNPWFVSGGTRKPLSSAGLGLRVNVFGYAVLGVNYVKPFDRPEKGWYWQFSLYPGF